MSDKPEAIGNIEIFYTFYVMNEIIGKWIPFQFDIACIHLVKLKSLPKGRIWNGSEWIPYCVKEHIKAFIDFMEEYEDGQADERRGV